jgi:hypothetical protein
MPRKQAAEIDRSGRVTASAGATVGSRRARQVTLFLEHYPQVRGGGRIAAPVGATICSRGGRELSSCHKQATEVECPAGVASLVGTTVRCLRTAEVTGLLAAQTGHHCIGRVAVFVP